MKSHQRSPILRTCRISTMTISELLQMLTAAIAVGAVIVSWTTSTRAIRANDRASKLQRVIETSAELQTQVALLSAEILPYWSDSETRTLYAQMPQAVKVHRAMEQIDVLSRLVNVHVDIADRPNRLGNPLVSAANMLADATMTLYLVLIPSEETSTHSVEEPLRYFANNSRNYPTASSDVELITKRVNSRGGPTDKGNIASMLVDECKEHFALKLAEYVRHSAGENGR
jgi:hypothetical protein